MNHDISCADLDGCVYGMRVHLAIKFRYSITLIVKLSQGFIRDAIFILLVFKYQTVHTLQRLIWLVKIFYRKKTCFSGKDTFTFEYLDHYKNVNVKDKLMTIN